jgi:hypothetical protein
MGSISGGFIALAFLVLVRRCDILLFMQGLMNYPLKPSCTWGNRPGFRTVAVTMAASPGGCGAVILIFWSGNNPVKYIDPDGRFNRYHLAAIGTTVAAVGVTAATVAGIFLSGGSAVGGSPVAVKIVTGLMVSSIVLWAQGNYRRFKRSIKKSCFTKWRSRTTTW